MASRGLRHASAASDVRLQSSIPPQMGSSSSFQPCGGAISFDIREPSENGCAAKATPPALRTAVQISRSVRPLWGISSSSPNTSRCPPLGETSWPTSTSTSSRQPSSPRRRASSVSWSVNSRQSAPASDVVRTSSATVAVPSEYVEWTCATHARPWSPSGSSTRRRSGCRRQRRRAPAARDGDADHAEQGEHHHRGDRRQ